ncbi:MAG TPA: substrate-binding domain-containing protein, partial [Natronosporangium sp.]|nr:substrate-binding domain-containing protein [Natronosporangium sp.]
VSAVLAYNDLMAIGLIEGLHARGVSVPGQISVVGIDDIALSRATRPKLTTVANPTAAAGRAAVDMLLQLNDDRRATARVSLRTELVVRESTGPGPYAGRPTAAPPGPRDGTTAGHAAPADGASTAAPAASGTSTASPPARPAGKE